MLLIFAAMLALALSARDSLLSCGQTLFKHGDRNCITAYTTGLHQLTELAKRLEAGTVSNNVFKQPVLVTSYQTEWLVQFQCPAVQPSMFLCTLIDNDAKGETHMLVRNAAL